jgi:hypothetical protein
MVQIFTRTNITIDSVIGARQQIIVGALIQKIPHEQSLSELDREWEWAMFAV